MTGAALLKKIKLAAGPSCCKHRCRTAPGVGLDGAHSLALLWAQGTRGDFSLRRMLN